MEAPKCELEFQSDIYCQKHPIKPAASTEIWLKLTRSLKEGWDPKIMTTGNDSNLNVVRLSSCIQGCFPDPQSAPHSQLGVLPLFRHSWL